MAKTEIKFPEKAIADLQRKLKNIPNKMKTRELSKLVRAMSTPVLKKARKLVPVGSEPRDTSEAPRLKDSLDKKIRAYRSRGVAVAVVGHRSKKAPHAHLVHEGTKGHIIRVGFKTSGSGAVTASVGSQGRPPLALSNGKRFFGKQVKHPGQKAFPYLKQATDRAANESIQAGAKKGRQILEKLAKE